jgi:hypothetical protein
LNAYIAEPTATTPSVHLDPHTGVLEFSGETYPENPLSVYKPIISWLEEYLEQVSSDTPVRVELQIRYMNTSSTKMFMTMFDMFEEAAVAGKDIRIRWHYNPKDQLAREMGQDLSEGLEVPFELVSE